MQVYCDNAAVVTVINSGKTSDSLMGTILRNTWLQVSAQEFEIRAVHLPGVTNRLADYLPRWQNLTKPRLTVLRVRSAGFPLINVGVGVLVVLS